MKRLPSFFILGAQKAGTTSLHSWLQHQPEVCLPTFKETHFFADDQRFQLGLEWYQDCFIKKQSNCLIGEVDPEYMFWPRTAQRIREYIYSPKMIFLFREPIKRAFSHYQMSVRRGFEPLGFVDALEAESVRIAGEKAQFSMYHHSYLARGRYSEQAIRYHEAFPDSNFLYIKFDDLVSAETSQETYEKICKFIGIISPVVPLDISEKKNPAGDIRFPVLLKIKRSDSPIKKLLAKLMTPRAKLKLSVALESFNLKPYKDKERLQLPKIPAHFLDAVQEEIVQLEILTGLDLNDWKEQVSNY